MLASDSARCNNATPQVCEAWLSVLLELLPILGREAVLRDVLPLALSKGQVDESVASRVLCCRLLGAITPWLVRLVLCGGCAGIAEQAAAMRICQIAGADHAACTCIATNHYTDHAACTCIATNHYTEEGRHRE